MQNKKLWYQRRRRICEILEAGSADDLVSRAYDIFSTLMTLTHVAVTVMYTFDEMELNHGIIVAMIRRGHENIVPRGNVVLKHNPWNGLLIRELDISRQTIIVMVKRGDNVLVPKGDLMLLEGDRVILYSRERISHASTIQV